MSKETITLKRDTLWKVATGIFALLFIVALFSGGLNFSGPDSQGTSGNSVVQQPNQRPSIVEASVDDDPVFGNENAPVTMIEFSDYQCPFCRKFWTETLPQIKSEYIDTGKVKFVYRDFPLNSIHPSAQAAAETAECVRDNYSEDAYWEIHDKIFSEQNILDGGDPIIGPVKGTVQFSENDLKNWASDLGYEIGGCLDSGKFTSEVQKDITDATAAGGRGTPYFVINGQPLSGAQPFSSFKQVIDAELS